MAGEGFGEVARELKLEPKAIQSKIFPFLDELVKLFGRTDRIDGPNKTRLFCLAVKNKTTNHKNQYVAVTTQRHCAGNHPVKNDSFHVEVQTKEGKPGPGWVPCVFSGKGGDKEWWEYDPPDQEISRDTMGIVKKARKSIQT